MLISQRALTPRPAANLERSGKFVRQQRLVMPAFDFIFNHPVPSALNGEEPWYHDFNIWIDANQTYIKNKYCELFEKSGELLNEYSSEQLEQGLWAIMGGNLDFSAYDLIWGYQSNLSINDKVELITSMFYLYKDLYSKNSLDTSCEMWWDSFAYDYSMDDVRDIENNEEDRAIQNAMFETLEKILSLESKDCQYAALHGLGHLRHPKTEKLITEFIAHNKNISDDMIAYAKACIKGDIM